MTDDASQTEELNVSTCWAMLRAAPVSRLAICAPGGPHIFPVNHLVDHGTIVIRTGPGMKLAAARSVPAVALEADGVDEVSGQAWSIVVRGPAREISGLHDLIDAEHLPLAPWHGGPKHRFLRIEAETITGRRFTVATADRWETLFTGRTRSAGE